MVEVFEPLTTTLEHADQLSRGIEEKYRNQKKGLPRLVTIPRSGFVIAHLMARQWDQQGLEMLNASVKKVAPPTGTELRGPAFERGQFPVRDEIEGANLLVVDAVCRTGTTLKYVVDALRARGAQSVKSAVLYYKPTAENVHRPNFYHPTSVYRQVQQSYTVFEWERNEHLRGKGRPYDESFDRDMVARIAGVSVGSAVEAPLA